jgi:hypothetical protein
MHPSSVIDNMKNVKIQTDLRWARSRKERGEQPKNDRWGGEVEYTPVTFCTCMKMDN